ncbi:MAG: glycoside hydrolase family 43 protein [Lachnospiraceae bacterium]|nr:glycoside hydrolase family 43 protein [Lachnospiraceae bacterium]
MSKEREPLVTNIFTADPSAHVFDGKLYIYPSHDIPHDGEDNDEGDEYRMEDYHILSMDNLEAPCVDNGEALHMKDVPWVSKQMWAPDAAYKNGTYYLYFPARDKDGIFRIGVATSTSPVGSFTPEPDYIQGSYSIDPAVLVDDDGRAYMYYGGLWGGQLEKWQSGSFDEDAPKPKDDEPAIGPMCAELNEDMKSIKGEPMHLTILDADGNPITAGNEDCRFFEGAWMHKYNGLYYLSYSTGTTHYVVYATSENPKGPFTYRGRILEPVIGWTTHHSIVEYNGKWYLFYHDCELSEGINHRRTVKYTELHYNEDGTIQTIHPYDHK